MTASFGKVLMLLGLILFGVGAFFYFAGGKLHWLGRLPGDIRVERPGFGFYAPLGTSLLLSVVLSLLFWLWGKFFR